MVDELFFLGGAMLLLVLCGLMTIMSWKRPGSGCGF